jgi:hypothetical protein
MTTREKIEAAFADVPYPGDDKIGDDTSCGECADIAEYFRGTTGREHSIKELQQQQWALSFFSPQALQYFLPAYMMASLDHWYEADNIPSSILYAWLPGEVNETEAMRQYRIERQSIFSPAQRAAIAAYLREYEAYDDPCRGEGDIPIAIGRLLNEQTTD